MQVQIVVNNVVSFINGPLPMTVIQRIKEACSYSIQGAEFSAYGQEVYCPYCRKQTREASPTDLYLPDYPEPGKRLYRKCLTHGWVKPISLWDGRQYLWDGRSNSFPTGIITRIVDVLTSNNITYTITDNRLAPITRELPWHGPKPRYYQQNAVRAIKKRSRGIIHASTGCGKCHADGTLILMYDGTTKKVEDILPGDLVMGMDSKPRTVVEVHHGEEELYRVQQIGGSYYDVTKDHILTGIITGRDGYKRRYLSVNKNYHHAGDMVDISVSDWFKATPMFRHVFKGFSAKVDTFGIKREEFIIDPYILGLWLGDGTATEMAITTMDQEVVDAWYSSEDKDIYISRVCTKGKSKAKTYYLTKRSGCTRNKYKAELRRLNVFKNKHIPAAYKFADIETRRKLLAGILDSDGYTHNGNIEIVQKIKRLADDIAFVARSVGLTVSMKEKFSKCQTGAGGIYYRMHIGGDFSEIPLKVKRRIPEPRKKYNPKRRLFGLTITPCGVGKFTGFSVKEEDKHYLLGDFTVVHNSLMLAWLIKNTCVNTLILAHTKSVFNQLTNSISNSLQVPVGQIGDGIADIHKFTVAMPQSLTETVWVPCKKMVKGVWKQSKKKVQRIKPQFQSFLANVELLGIDEAHRTSCKTVQLIANSCPNAYYRVGVSATPWRDDMLDILIEAATGRTAYHYSATQAIKDGFLAQPTIHLVHFKQERQPVYKDVQVKDKTSGNLVWKKEKIKYADIYDKVITENTNRNDLITRIAAKCYTEGKSVLIIVRHIKHGQNLFDMLSKYIQEPDLRYVNGLDDADYLQQTLNDLDQKNIRVCVATGIFSEGVDIRRLDVVINATAGDSSVNAMQIVGRALRKVVDPVTGRDLKPKVDIYDIYDTNIRWFSQHAANRQLIYSTEPGYIIQDEDESEYYA